MIYSSRLKKILEYCLIEDDYIRMDTLAKQVKTSTRTIFRELKDIDSDLAPYGLHILTKAGKGVQIVGTKEAKAILLQELKTQNIQYLNKEERRDLLIFELLHNGEGQKLIHFANLFQVSEATISNDLDSVERWIQEYHLTLLRKSTQGIVLQGEESNLRKAMTAILHQSIRDDKAFHTSYYFDSQMLLNQIFMDQQTNGIMQLLNQTILERILSVFHQHQHELALDRYAQASYIGLIIHLVICIDRIMKKEEITQRDNVLEMVKEDSSFQQAKRMAWFLEMEFDIDIPEVEVAFIALHIKGAKINNTEHSDLKESEIQQLSKLIRHMIATFDFKKRIYLSQDEELFQGLITHLGPTIIRLKNDLPIYNPLLMQLKELYSELFDQTKKACMLLEHEYGCLVSDDEIGFITMHIGASLERMKERSRKHMTTKIGVVCASGIGMSALLAARIQKVFRDHVQLEVLSLTEIEQKKDDCRLYISTFQFAVEDKVVLQVSPLLNMDDITKIKQAMFALTSTVKKEALHDVHTNFKQQLLELQQLSTSLLEVQDYLLFHEVEANQQITDLILIAARLASVDVVNQQQIADDLNKRELLGSIIMKDYRFALLHTKSEGINHCMVQILYPQGNCFHTGAMQGMYFVMVLLLPAHASTMQQEILSTLSRSIIENDAYYEALCNHESDEVSTCITSILKAYLRNKIND